MRCVRALRDGTQGAPAPRPPEAPVPRPPEPPRAKAPRVQGPRRHHLAVSLNPCLLFHTVTYSLSVTRLPARPQRLCVSGRGSLPAVCAPQGASVRTTPVAFPLCLRGCAPGPVLLVFCPLPSLPGILGRGWKSV